MAPSEPDQLDRRGNGMHLCLAVVLTTLTVLAATAPWASAGGNGYTRCRPPSFRLPGDALLARHVSCKSARRVIATFFAVAQAQGPRAEAAGYRCVDLPDGSRQEPEIRCRHGRRRVLYRGPQG